MVSRLQAVLGIRWLAAALLSPALASAAPVHEPQRRYVSSQAYYHALRAELALAQEDRGTAADELQLALVYDPESVLLTERLARLALTAGRLRKARRLVEHARGLAPRDVMLRVLEAEVALKAKDFARAERILRRAVLRTRSRPEPALALARLLEQRGRVREAIRVLSRAAARIPDAPEPLDALASVEVRRGRPRLALDALERAAVRDPGRLPRQVRLDRLYAGLGWYRKAADDWWRYFEAGAFEVEALARATRAAFRAGQTARGDALVARWRGAAPGNETELAFADILAEEGYFAEAAAAWEELRKVAALSDARTVAHARALVAVGRNRAALRALRGIGRGSPVFSSAQRWLATVLVRGGARARAEQVLDRALENDPGDRALGLRLGMLRPAPDLSDLPDGLGRIAEYAMRLARGSGLEVADGWLTALTQDRPGLGPEIARLRAELWTQHAAEVPVQVLRAALDTQPEAAGWRAALALALTASGRKLREARRYAEAALSAAPDDPRAVRAMGVLLLRQGARRHAEECLGRAVRLSPGTAGAWESWGDALWAGGRTGPAKVAYRNGRVALEADPWLGAAARRAMDARLAVKVEGGPP